MSSGDTENPLQPVIQAISDSLSVYDYKTTFQNCIIAVDLLRNKVPGLIADDLDGDGSNGEDNMVTPKWGCDPGIIGGRRLSSGRDPHQSLHLSKESVMEFVVDSLVTALKATTFLSIKPSDTSIGHLIVLSQYRWPKYVDIFKTCISCIRKPLEQLPVTGSKAVQPGLHKFSYPPFSEYVFLPDFLEEFAYLATDERLTLVLHCPTASTQTKSMTTRGVNKGAKEELRSSLVSQMKRSRNAVDSELMIDFISSTLRPFLSDVAV